MKKNKHPKQNKNQSRRQHVSKTDRVDKEVKNPSEAIVISEKQSFLPGVPPQVLMLLSASHRTAMCWGGLGTFRNNRSERDGDIGLSAASEPLLPTLPEDPLRAAPCPWPAALSVATLCEEPTLRMISGTGRRRCEPGGLPSRNGQTGSEAERELLRLSREELRWWVRARGGLSAERVGDGGRRGCS